MPLNAAARPSPPRGPAAARTSSGWRAAWLLGLVLGLLCAPGPAGAQGGAAAESFAFTGAAAFPGALESALAEPETERALSVPALLRRLYQSQDFQPLWRTPSQARALLRAAEAAADDGLDPRDYHLERLRRLLAAGPAGPRAAAERELLLTDALARLAYHLRFGKVDPRRLDRHWNYTRALGNGDPAAWLSATAQAADPGARLDALRPGGRVYTALREALACYRRIEAAGGWPRVPPGPTLDPGERDPRIARLRARLAAEPVPGGPCAPGTGPATAASESELKSASASASGPRPGSESGRGPGSGSGSASGSGSGSGSEPGAASGSGTGSEPESASASAPEAEHYTAALEETVRSFQRRHGLEADGRVGPRTLAALNTPVRARIATLRVNLERLRWVYRDLEAEFLAVNIASFQAALVRGGEVVWRSRVIVGRPYRQTPVFKAEIQYLVLNPSWTVPPTILARDVLPALRRDPDYLARKGLQLLGPGGESMDPATLDWARLEGRRFPGLVRQPPGPDNALGRIKFMFPNPYLVYLHDTPARALFDRTERTFSSGCIRLERPLELAALLLGGETGWDLAALQQAVEQGGTQRIDLPRPVPLMLLYLTAYPEADGRLVFPADVYQRDAALLEALDGPFVFSPPAGYPPPAR